MSRGTAASGGVPRLVQSSRCLVDLRSAWTTDHPEVAMLNIKLPAIVRPPWCPHTEQVGAVIRRLAWFRGSRWSALARSSAERPGRRAWFNFSNGNCVSSSQLWIRRRPLVDDPAQAGSVAHPGWRTPVVTASPRTFEEFPPSTRILCVSGQRRSCIHRREGESHLPTAVERDLDAPDEGFLPPGTTPTPPALLRQPADLEGRCP